MHTANRPESDTQWCFISIHHLPMPIKHISTNIHISQLLWCPRSPQSPPTAFQPTAPPTQLPTTNLASLTYQHLRMLLQQNPLDASEPPLSPLNPTVTYCCLGQRSCMSLSIHFPHHSASMSLQAHSSHPYILLC